ncbi:MAG: GIY-YIG nuclease family protein [Anaerolineae bacterium]|nr:GIY-YIG nuclease family protein [Anaerolineae bacterium]
MQFYVYLLKCADDSYYTGSTSDVERRLWEHQQGTNPTSYTHSRRPVELVWAGEFQTRREALDFEHQVKGWTKAKKEALCREDWNGIHKIVKAERKRREAERKSSTKPELYDSKP